MWPAEGEGKTAEGEKDEWNERGYLPTIRFALANHIGVCIEMRNGADRPATITPIS